MVPLPYSNEKGRGVQEKTGGKGEKCFAAGRVTGGWGECLCSIMVWKPSVRCVVRQRNRDSGCRFENFQCALDDVAFFVDDAEILVAVPDVVGHESL